MSAEETKSKQETGTESEVTERDVIMTEKGEEVVGVRRRGRRGRRPKAKEGEMLSTTTATAAEPKLMPDVQHVASMLVRYEKILDRIEHRLKPIKRIEKESGMIKALRIQIKDLSKQVSRLEKSINRLKTAGKGRRGKVRGRKARAKR